MAEITLSRCCQSSVRTHLGGVAESSNETYDTCDRCGKICLVDTGVLMAPDLLIKAADIVEQAQIQFEHSIGLWAVGGDTRTLIGFSTLRDADWRDYLTALVRSLRAAAEGKE